MNNYFEKYKSYGLVLAMLIVYRHALNYSVYSLPISSLIFWDEKVAYSVTGFATVAFAIFSSINFYRDLNWNLIRKKLTKRLYTLVLPYSIAVLVNWLFFAILPHLPIVSKYVSSGLYPLTAFSFFKTLVTGGGTTTMVFAEFNYMYLFVTNYLLVSL